MRENATDGVQHAAFQPFQLHRKARPQAGRDCEERDMPETGGEKKDKEISV
jgi:hypothetical protein